MENANRDPLLGHDIAGRYRIEAKIGQGGMGSVYRAHNIVTGKVVAIKVLLQDLAAYDSFVQRFLHEARATAYLNHPHAINIIDCGQEDEIVYLLMEYVEGRTLTEVMRAEGPFSAPMTASILRQVCAVVADAHAQSIVHRDLKPDNIMLQEVAGETHYVKVLDFGIAKVLDEQKRGNLPVSKNIFVGTPEYASPEQCNSKSPTHLSDIYSLGTILYEMLTGHPPFRGDPMEVMFMHVNEAPRPVREVRPDLGAEVEGVLQRALSKDPAERQQNVLDLARQFEAAVFGQAAVTAVPLPALAGSMVMTKTAPRIHTTASATHPPTATGMEGTFQRLFGQRKGRWGLWLGTLFFALSLGVGYRFFRWYTTVPQLPPGPELVLPVAPSAPAHPTTIAERQFDEGSRESAVRELQRLLDDDQGYNPQAHRLLGQVYFDQGDYSGAAVELAAAIDQMNGVYPEGRYWLGRLFLEQGDEAKASEEFRRAEQNSKGRHLPSLVALLDLALRRDDPDEAETLFRQVIAQANDDPDDILQVGKALLLRRDYDLAVREVRRAIESKQGVFPEAEVTLGRALLAKEERPQALRVLNEAVAHRAGNFPEARMVLGKALYQDGAVQEALSALRAAIRLRGGGYPQAEFMLGTLLADWAVGQYEEARRVLQLALSHRGGRFPQAERALALLYWARLGQPAEARRIWTRLEDRAWLEQTEDAVFIRAGASAMARRMIGSRPLESGQSMTFHLIPLPVQQQAPMVNIETGNGGLSLRFAAEDDRQPARWRAFAVISHEERLLRVEPLENRLMGNMSAAISIYVDRTHAVLNLGGEKIGPFRVDLPVQVLAAVSGGHAVIYNLRESGIRRQGGDRLSRFIPGMARYWILSNIPG